MTTASRLFAGMLLVGALALVAVAVETPGAASGSQPVRLWKIGYTAHNGTHRLAWVILPAWYGPGRNPPLPLVISPHGRGADGRRNTVYWGDLPAVGRFAVICPDGTGRVFQFYSYGYAGQIDDLARMPDIATRALPWLNIDRSRIYALGSSMGGQETLLLVARRPALLAGAAAMDSVTDLARRYHELPALPCDRRCLARFGRPEGVILQSTLRDEVGGTPGTAAQEYALRSPLDQAPAIAVSGVPLQIWWSTDDRVVQDQRHQSQALYDELLRLNPDAPVTAYVGRWMHSTEMRSDALLPIALEGFGLLPKGFEHLPPDVHCLAPGAPAL